MLDPRCRVGVGGHWKLGFPPVTRLKQSSEYAATSCSKLQSPKTGSPTSGLGREAVKAPSGINPFSATTGFSCNTTSR